MLPENGLQGPIEAFNHTIALGVGGSGVQLLCPQELANTLHEVC